MRGEVGCIRNRVMKSREARRGEGEEMREEEGERRKSEETRRVGLKGKGRTNMSEGIWEDEGVAREE